MSCDIVAAVYGRELLLLVIMNHGPTTLCVFSNPPTVTFKLSQHIIWYETNYFSSIFIKWIENTEKQFIEGSKRPSGHCHEVKFKCKHKKLKEIRKERKSRRLTQCTLVIKHKGGKSFKQHLFTKILSDLIFIRMHTPIAVHTCACVSTLLWLK